MNRCTEEIEAGTKKTFIHKFTVFILLTFILPRVESLNMIEHRAPHTCYSLPHTTHSCPYNTVANVSLFSPLSNCTASTRLNHSVQDMPAHH